MEEVEEEVDGYSQPEVFNFSKHAIYNQTMQY